MRAALIAQKKTGSAATDHDQFFTWLKHKLNPGYLLKAIQASG
jgi:hypothetical protein